jgi:hypothetical protein
LTLVIKGIDEKRLREFKAEAIRRGLKLSQAFEEAIWLWLNKREILGEADANNIAYEREKHRLKKYHGKYAVFAQGELIGIYDTIDGVTEALKKLSPRPKHAIVVRIGVDDISRGEMEWWGGSISQ